MQLTNACVSFQTKNQKVLVRPYLNRYSDNAEPITTKNVMTVGALVAALPIIANGALYFGLNFLLNISNRWLLGVKGLAMPLFLTMAHMLFSFLVLGIVNKFQWNPKINKHLPETALIGTMQAANVALNNMSLVYLPLSVAQIVR